MVVKIQVKVFWSDTNISEYLATGTSELLGSLLQHYIASHKGLNLVI
jgi:hypothetical protein